MQSGIKLEITYTPPAGVGGEGGGRGGGEEGGGRGEGGGDGGKGDEDEDATRAVTIPGVYYINLFHFYLKR